MLAKVNQVRGVLPRTIHGLNEEIGAFVAMGRYSLREGQQVIQKKKIIKIVTCVILIFISRAFLVLLSLFTPTVTT